MQQNDLSIYLISLGMWVLFNSTEQKSLSTLH